MRRFLPLLLVWVLAAGVAAASLTRSPWWWLAAGPLLAAAGLGARDLLQRRRPVLRNHPLVGRLRYPVERVPGPSSGTGRREPPAGDTDVDEYLVPSLRPVEPAGEPPLVRVGGPDCSQPYDMALLNVSAMSFGALSSRAVLALNRGAALGASRTTPGRAGCRSTICGAGATSSGRSARGISAAAAPTAASTHGSSRTRRRCPR